MTNLPLASEPQSAEPRPRKSILESPWYWVYLFCAAALIGLVLMGPKFAARQAQLEMQSQGRQRAGQQARETPRGQVPANGAAATVTLQPLYVLFGLVLVLAWTVLWWQHFRRPFPAADQQAGQEAWR